MNYKFGLNSNSDIILGVENTNYNLGYHYGLKLPIMIWLSQLQCGQGNMFSRMRLPKPKQALPKLLEEKVEELLKETFDFANDLPLPLEEFNKRAFIDGFSRFNDGTNQMHYNFNLDEGNKLNLHRSYQYKDNKIILVLGHEDFKSLVRAYLNFLNKYSKLERYREEVTRIVPRLGEYKKQKC